MLKKLLQRWGIAHRSPSRSVDMRKGGKAGGKTASLASPEPSSCSSSSETCSFSSVSSYNAENNAKSRTGIRSRAEKKSSDVFACSSPISSPSSCGKQFREMQTQTDHSPIRRKTSDCMCAYCQVPFCRNNESSACCPSYPTSVLPYLHPNQISTCCGFDPAAGVRMPATRFQFPLCSQSLSLCYGPCLGPAPPPVHGHHLPMTFCQPQSPPQQQPGCVVRRLDPLLPHHGRQSASAEFH